MLYSKMHDLMLCGYLKTMPVLTNNDLQEMEISIDRKHHGRDSFECYRVIISWKDAIYLLNYGYQNMLLTVYASLRVQDGIEIVANKISFTGLISKEIFVEESERYFFQSVDSQCAPVFH